MKQIIVLIATVVLGISLSGGVLDMGGDVKGMMEEAKSEITETLDYSISDGFALLGETS